LISAPYANSFMANANPEHYTCPNEATFTCYDPNYPLFRTAMYGLVKPWRIVRNMPNVVGCIEVILEPYKDAKGRVCWPKNAESVKTSR